MMIWQAKFPGITFLACVAFGAGAAAMAAIPEPPPLSDREGRAVHVSTVAELQQAVRNAEPGDTILVADGTYNLERAGRTGLLFADKRHVTLRGASGDPTKVVLHGGGWGSPTDDYGAISNNMLMIQRCDDITIAYLTFAEGRQYGIMVNPHPHPPNPSNIHIYNCHFRNIAIRAIKGSAAADRRPVVDGSVRFCTFENTKVQDPSWRWALFDGNYVSGIDMMYLQDWVFSDNVFRNIKGATGGARGALFVWNQSRNITVERNVFIGCDRGIAFGNPSQPTGYQADTLHVYDSVIRNNFIVVGTTPAHTNTKGIELCWVDTVQVYHNTVYAPDPRCPGIHYFQNIHRLHLANNLVRGRLDGEGDSKAEGNVVGDLDGYFVAPAAGDLRLTEQAANALNRGIPLPAVTEDFEGKERGTPPTPGAFELQNS